jgi:DNA mismatch repair protein MutS
MSASLLPPAEGASPAMAQWFALKAEYPDALLFFRMGDFYELFFTDAEAAAAALDIALTARGEHAGAPIPMCGVPVHAAEAYLARLIRRGFRVAVAEQMEDPKTRTGKAPIRRDIVRLITPGTLTEDSLLESGRANLLLALAVDGDAIGAAWVDISTGLFATAACHPRELPALLGRLEPAEILAPASLKLGDYEAKRAPEQVASPAGAARKRLAEGFKVASLEAFGTFSDNEAVAAALVLDYVRGTQAGAMPHLSRPEPQGMRGVLAMDAATRTSLEILRTRDGGTELTLRAAVQRTVTAGGGRLLAAWLSAPLTEHGRIVARQDGWSWLLANSGSADALRAALRGVPDMARALSRLSLNRGGPRDLTALRDGLLVSRQVTRLLAGPLPAVLAEALACPAMDASLETMLAAALKDPVPLRLDEGAVIKPGFDGELDAERTLRDDSRKTLAGLQLEYAQRYGVASLKIRHHAQLGYVIEAPASAAERLRQHPDLTLRQGMANGARFSTAELADLDRRISEAGERAAQRERAVFAHLVQTALAQADALRACSEALALLDVLLSAAQLARGGRWCRPEIADDQSFLVRAGRHPVVEAALASPGGAHAFVPNDCDLAPDRRLLLLTGPNMAGKSTFLRQNALLTILAQAGLPVPAESMRIGIVDRLFSRVGASDELARGRSTFMVEMTETAAILHQAGPRSLVVVDEIGRGTSTLDGLAIAWAVLEALHSTIGCRTIFATHFHELAGLADRLKRLRPHTMRVKEWRGSVVFLHEVAEGAGRRSWGVHVAELAGVPAPVVRRAAALLAALEKQGGPLGLGGSLDALPLFAASASAEVPALPSDNWTEEVMLALAEIEPDKLSPLDALATLYRLKSLMPVPADHTT